MITDEEKRRDSGEFFRIFESFINDVDKSMPKRTCGRNRKTLVGMKRPGEQIGRDSSGPASKSLRK